MPRIHSGSSLSIPASGAMAWNSPLCEDRHGITASLEGISSPLKAGSTTVCLITVSSGHGTCTLSAKALKPGTYHLVASYPGNAIYLASASASKTLNVAA
jgi:hypothetical protein